MCYLTEKYTRGVSAVESILTLDRLRQNVAVKELETAHGQPLSMRKTVSVPNFSQVRISPQPIPSPIHPIEPLLLRRFCTSTLSLSLPLPLRPPLLPMPPLIFVLSLTHLTHSSKINQENLTKSQILSLFTLFLCAFTKLTPHQK